MTPDKRRSAAALFARVYELGDARGPLDPDRPVVRLCNLILLECLTGGFSELRATEQEAHKALLQVNHQGSWKTMMSLPVAAHAALVNRLKVMANLDLAKRPAQEGDLKVRGHGREVVIAMAVRLRPSGLEEVLLRFSGNAPSPQVPENTAA